MKRVTEFLNALDMNNNKPWFDEHRQEYLEAKAYFEDFVVRLIERIEHFDDTIYGLKASDCTYRIYRDIRFSKDKTPYKTHMGAYICPKGKKSGFGGYYFHVEGSRREGLSSHFLATGAVCMPNNVIRSIREDVYSLCEEFEACVDSAEGFTLDTANKMKTTPRDFPKESKANEYLKLRDFILLKPVEESYVLSTDLLDRLEEDFSRTKAFNDFINRAIAAERE